MKFLHVVHEFRQRLSSKVFYKKRKKRKVKLAAASVAATVLLLLFLKLHLLSLFFSRDGVCQPVSPSLPSFILSLEAPLDPSITSFSCISCLFCLVVKGFSISFCVRDSVTSFHHQTAFLLYLPSTPFFPIFHKQDLIQQENLTSRQQLNPESVELALASLQVLSFFSPQCNSRSLCVKNLFHLLSQTEKGFLCNFQPKCLHPSLSLEREGDSFGISGNKKRLLVQRRVSCVVDNNEREISVFLCWTWHFSVDPVATTTRTSTEKWDEMTMSLKLVSVHLLLFLSSCLRHPVLTASFFPQYDMTLEVSFSFPAFCILRTTSRLRLLLLTMFIRTAFPLFFAFMTGMTRKIFIPLNNTKNNDKYDQR